MKEIVPTIFATDIETFEKKLKLLSKITNKIHLDFMDGKFTKNKSISFSEMKNIQNYKNIFFETHLMAFDPIKYIPQIKELGIKKAYIQMEAFENDTQIKSSIETFKKENIEIALVINPTTPIEVTYPFVEQIDSLLIMSVIPGKEGQKFLKSVLFKIEEIKEKYPNLTIEVDGGVNDDNAKEIFKVGTNILNVGSFISSNKDPKQAYEKLKEIADKN
ncbi:MAG: ribulose-phosphate 3-epimerase [bacterium]